MNESNHIRRILNSRLVKRTNLFFRKNMADIFSVLAGIGVIATGISAYELGKTRAEILDDSERSSISKKSTIATTKTIGFGAGTIGCIYGARHYGKLKEKSLLAACSVLALYARRKKPISNTESETEACEYGHDLRGYDKTGSIESTGTGDILFVEDLTGRQFTASIGHVQECINQLQDEFERHNFVSLNSFYGYLGISSTSAGDILGWSVNQTILDPYLNEEDYTDMKDALTDLMIFVNYWEGVGYVIHYPVMPIGGLAGCGPANY